MTNQEITKAVLVLHNGFRRRYSRQYVHQQIALSLEFFGSAGVELP